MAESNLEEIYGQDIVDVQSLLSWDTESPTKVVLPSGKGSMWILPLTRHDVLTGRKLVDMGEITVAEMEAEWITKALVMPEMSVGQVTTWQKTRGSVRDITHLTEKIAEISGTKPGTPKSDIQDVRASSGNGMGNAHSGASK